MTFSYELDRVIAKHTKCPKTRSLSSISLPDVCETPLPLTRCPESLLQVT